MGGVKHEYTLDGTKILREAWGNNVLIPFYDNEDSVCGISYNYTPYYFIKNQQGDVIAITNANAEVVARYSYDAWGVPTIKQDTSGCQIASVNPYRYRCYYYDAEIAKYYLQSRYYDAVVGRFINGDNAQAILSEGLGCIGYNIFTYCQNTPINGSDIDGQSFGQVFAKIILGILLGAFIQLVFDILDYLVALISNPDASISPNPLDYVTSIFSSILAFFDIRKRWIRIFLNVLVIVLSYIGRPINSSFWSSLLKDITFIFISEIIGGALDRKKTKKIEKVTKLIKQNKKKLSYALQKAKLRKRTVSINQTFEALGIAIAFSLDISNKLISTIADLFMN